MESNNQSEREKIAARLKEARTLSGLSQAQAAEKLNLQRPAISEIESGRRKVSAEEIIMFSNLYRVDMAWLLLKENEGASDADEQYKFAARELSKVKKEDLDKVMGILKMFQK